MATVEDIDVQMAEMDIEAEENEELCFDEEVEETSNKFELCLIGRFLTEKNLNVKAMKSKMADVWRPAMGINIKEVKKDLFLFQFYHKDDLDWVQKGGPWSFDNAIPVFNSINMGEDPLKVPLNEVSFWIQIHDLPTGYMSESVGRQLGNFFGMFLEYDPKNNTGIWRECMRIRIKVDIRKPLKRKKKIVRKNASEFIVSCKYERLGDFYFRCGMLSHTERFCQKKFQQSSEMEKEWGGWLRAQPRRVAGKSKWLREDGDGDWSGKYGIDSKDQNMAGNQGYGLRKAGTQARSNREGDINNIKLKEVVIFKQGDVGKAGDGSNILLSNGPSDEELDGLDIEARKRKRLGHGFAENMDTSNIGFAQNDSALSNVDCAGSNNNILATLAEQASRPL